MAISFPFVEVSPIDLAFPVVPNYKEVLDALPEEYDEQRFFMAAAEKWFRGTFQADVDLPGYRPKAETIEDAVKQRDYIRVWAGTYEPKHQDKIAVIGWLLSLAFEKEELLIPE